MLRLDTPCACRIMGFGRDCLSARAGTSLQFNEVGAEEQTAWAKKSTLSAATSSANDHQQQRTPEHSNYGEQQASPDARIYVKVLAFCPREALD
jgi:hypothetical protein